MADPVRAIADAVLYEGYILWPYRRSAMKNSQRWTFGGVYPRGHSETREDDPWVMQAQCLALGAGTVDVGVRFLHVVRRQVRDGAGAAVDELTAGGERHLSWDEATEREISTPGIPLGGSRQVPLAIGEGREEERLGDAGSVERTWKRLEGSIDVAAEELRDGVHRVTVRVSNTTPFASGTREQTLEQTFCSCHAVLRAGDGAEFASLTDPPPELRADADACVNEGTWPVLVGEPHERGVVLASPIILEDHPRIAPESPGDLFDGGEIDQMLVLNILSLTDEEKDEMRATDPKAREILERTEALTPEQLMALHGTIRELRYADEPGAMR